MLKVTFKSFSELTTKELYNILRLRSEVFVVEQQCIYQDIDNKDHRAIHICGYKNGALVAYTRVFQPGEYFRATAIGRVVVEKNSRQFGFGREIMKKTLDYLVLNKLDERITLSAQEYLTAFYKDFGFAIVGKGYLEDGIPHIKMEKKRE